MADNVNILSAIRDGLQRLSIRSTRENMDILLGCIQALDNLIQEAQNNDSKSETE